MHIRVFLKPHRDSWKDHSESITLNCKEKKREGTEEAFWELVDAQPPARQGQESGNSAGSVGSRGATEGSETWLHALPEAGMFEARAPLARLGDRPSLSPAENPRLVLRGDCHSLFRLLQRNAQPGRLLNSRSVFLTGLEGGRGQGSGVLVPWPGPSFRAHSRHLLVVLARWEAGEGSAASFIRALTLFARPPRP